MKKVLFPFLLTLLLSSQAFGGMDEVANPGQEVQEPTLYHESHALLIGVSQYSKGWPNLPGVSTDIERVGKALRQHGFNVVTLSDPTRREMEDAFDNFINDYGHHPENRLLFYFAGHGHTLKLAYGGDMGYIIPGDAPPPHIDKKGFLKVAMDMQLVEVFAKRIQAKHALFMFDSCFSGSIFSMSRGIPDNISFKVNQPVRQFITAGGADEKVPDESIFSSQFIEALNGAADFDKDGFLTGTELGEFLHNQVTNYSKGSQHPKYGKIRDPHLDKGDFVFQTGQGQMINVSLNSGENPNQGSSSIASRTASLTLGEIHALLQDLPSTRSEDQLKKERTRLFDKNLIGLGKLSKRTLLSSADSKTGQATCRNQCEASYHEQSREAVRQCRQTTGTFKFQHENSLNGFNECMSLNLSGKARTRLKMCLAQCGNPN